MSLLNDKGVWNQNEGWKFYQTLEEIILMKPCMLGRENNNIFIFQTFSFHVFALLYCVNPINSLVDIAFAKKTTQSMWKNSKQ